MRCRGMIGTTRTTAIYLMTAGLLAISTALPTTAQGFGFSFGPGAPREYPYPAEPQYQYPRMDGRADLKCPKGQKPFQGKCRKFRPVY